MTLSSFSQHTYGKLTLGPRNHRSSDLGKTGSDNFDVIGEMAELHWVYQSARSEDHIPKRAGELPIKRDVLRQLVRFVKLDDEIAT